MLRRPLRSLPMLAVLMLPAASARAQQPASASSAAAAEIRSAVRRYDDALRRADSAAVEKFWATEYTFINPRGERLTRADRLANLRSGRTAFDSLAHAKEEQLALYGDLALYSTLLTLRGRYGGAAHEGQFRASVVWVRRDGRRQQLTSQMTPVLNR